MTDKKLEFPCLVELFGHNRISGMISEHALGNSVMIRIDVPETNQNPAFTKFVNPSSVYALNPIAEEMMHQMAEEIKAKPIQFYDLQDVQRKLMEEVNEARKQLEESN